MDSNANSCTMGSISRQWLDALDATRVYLSIVYFRQHYSLGLKGKPTFYFGLSIYLTHSTYSY